jgi:hypothetical protein
MEAYISRMTLSGMKSIKEEFLPFKDQLNMYTSNTEISFRICSRLFWPQTEPN